MVCIYIYFFFVVLPRGRFQDVFVTIRGLPMLFGCFLRNLSHWETNSGSVVAVCRESRIRFVAKILMQTRKH